MAGEWLKFDKATLDKPEVLAIASAMECDPDLVVGKLLRMWSWFDTHTENGNARGVTLALLDSILRVTGFAENVQKVGWLVVSDSGIRLPNFDRHCGETAKQRALTAKRVAGFKASHKKGNAPSVTSALPREEKRREEEKQEHSSASADRIPYDGIVSAYHDALPMLPAVRKLTDQRKRKLRKCWQDDQERQSLDYWKTFFAYVAGSDFLTGRNGRFTACDFEWLVDPSRHLKVSEGKYENREAA
jgi:hypothetical protein